MNQWTERSAEYAALLARLQEIARKNGLVLNPEVERVEKVVGLMTENVAKTGLRICPCKQSKPIDPERDTRCPCPSWKEDLAQLGHCYCRLFYRE